jgi:hypothetical protein
MDEANTGRRQEECWALAGQLRMENAALRAAVSSMHWQMQQEALNGPK